MTPGAFKSGMRRLAGCVCLITTTDAGARYGLVATSVVPVSAEPPTLLVCVNRSASIFPHMVASPHFSVNLLGNTQSPLIARFTDDTARHTRFDDNDWGETLSGQPRLLEAEATFDCSVAQFVDSGTHRIFFGQICGIAMPETPPSPLIWLNGRGHIITECLRSLATS